MNARQLLARRLIAGLSLACWMLLTLAAPLHAADKKNQAAKPAPVVPPREGKREKLKLFNGKDLTGWVGHKKYWSVKDGIIVGKNTEPVPVSTYLLTERKFSDFRITCDFRLAESEMHSGIALWGRIAPERGDPYTYAGLLVMFPSGYGFYDLYGRAGIHQNGAIARPVGKQHDWNRIEILAQGNRVRFVLNGKLVSDWREPEVDRIHEGPIGLQLHANPKPQEVQWRDINLETFPEDRLLTVDEPKNEKLSVYIGTHTAGGKSKGIYRSDLNLADGRLSEPRLAAEAVNPTFLALHPSGRFLYAVSEVADSDGKKSGGVAAFSLDSATGELTALNKQPSGGAGPCHVNVDRPGRHVLVANYGSGSAAAIEILPGGKLGKQTAHVQHHGAGTDPRRQEAPHAHSINLDPANRYAMVCDLGIDLVAVYHYDPAKGTLEANDPPGAKVAPGSGPRHFAFHPNGRHAYVINEMASTVTAFDYDAAAGKLTELQTLSTLPANFQGSNTAADVHVHPSGKFLYGSNRGHDSIAMFQIDPTGRLAPVGHQQSNIKTPRNFGIDPSGRYLVVANQDGDSLVVFGIDGDQGGLQPTGSMISVPRPMCVKFLRPRG
jgi:6-phosphogluconolactonase